MTIRTALMLVMSLGALCWLPASNAADLFATRLDSVPIDPRTQATVTGDGEVRARLDGSELTIEGTFSGLAGPASVARLHVGSAVGARGPAVHDLVVTQNATGTVTGTVRLSRREIDALNAGRLYVQIHSQPAPEGNLWGWLLPRE